MRAYWTGYGIAVIASGVLLIAGCVAKVEGGTSKQGLGVSTENDGKSIDSDAPCGDPTGGKDEPPPGTPDPSQCTDNIIGDGTTCLDPVTVKETAYTLCTDAGAVLVSLSPANDCADGGSTIAKLTCCLPSEPSPPPEPSPTCIWDSFGNGTCQDAATIKQQAEDACAASGLVLAELYTSEDCPDGGGTAAKFSCCE